MTAFRRLGITTTLFLSLVACTPEATTVDSTSPVEIPPTTQTPAETTTTVPDTTTTTAAPTTTAVAEAEIPLPDTSGDDWFRIMSELENFAGWLFENPRTDLVNYFVHPGSEAEENFAPTIQERAENQWRTLPGGRAVPVEVAPQSVEPDRVRLLYVYDFAGATVVDRDGNIVEEVPGTPRQALIVTLAKGDDDRWRLRQSELLGDLE